MRLTLLFLLLHATLAAQPRPAWRQYTMNDGLPDNATYDMCEDSLGRPYFAVQGDSLVCAGGNAGLNKITDWHPGEMPKKLPPQYPNLIGVLVNNQKWTGNTNAFASFSSSENDVALHFFVLNFRQNGRISYRFRLQEGGTWQTTMATSARFSSLAPGNYRFEVQAQNEDGIWGNSAAFPFLISPPWWACWPFRALIFLLFASVVFAFYHWRTRQLKTRFTMQKQLSELEQTALRAQMNPHFIANCLNSIQRCVLENQNETAVLYIARFGKLTRAAFEFSGQQQITLEEELTYLENYLNLEKMRFKDQFQFTIAVDSSIDTRNTIIAPMLIQPVVENAIKHAFKGIEHVARLDIHFTQLKKGLEIRCLDNGRGLPNGFSLHQADKQGHALSILQKRFDLLSKSGHHCQLVLQNRSDGELGTLAVLIYDVGIN